MSWADRLRRLTGGTPQHRIAGPLSAFQRRTAAQVERLAAAAAQAPNAAAERELHALAAAERQLTDAAARALSERAAVPPAVTAAAQNGAVARNHWGRLVAVLDACQAARDQLLVDLPRLLDADPSLANALHAWAHQLAAEVLALRALIARADPQAID